MNPVHGYGNHIAAYQSPKGRSENGEDNRARPSNCYTNNPKYAYLPFDGGREPLRSREFDGSGTADETLRCWCSECGAPADGPDQAACYRCGSTEIPRCK